MSRRSSTKRACSKARFIPRTRRFSARRPTPRFTAPRRVLLVNDVGAHSGDGDDLEKFGGAAGPDNAGIEFVQVKANVVNQWLALQRQEPGSHRERHRQGPASGIVRSARKTAPGPGCRHRAGSEDRPQCRRPTFPAKPASTSSSARITIISAWASSSPWRLRWPEPCIPAPTTTLPAPRASSNWRAGSRTQPKHQRGILFMTFAGEELGLLGSSYYVNHPAAAARKTTSP